MKSLKGGRSVILTPSKETIDSVALYSEISAIAISQSFIHASTSRIERRIINDEGLRLLPESSTGGSHLVGFFDVEALFVLCCADMLEFRRDTKNILLTPALLFPVNFLLLCSSSLILFIRLLALSLGHIDSFEYFRRPMLLFVGYRIIGCFMSERDVV
jgi:hypothetical protein